MNRPKVYPQGNPKDIELRHGLKVDFVIFDEREAIEAAYREVDFSAGDPGIFTAEIDMRYIRYSFYVLLCASEGIEPKPRELICDCTGMVPYEQVGS